MPKRLWSEGANMNFMRTRIRGAFSWLMAAVFASSCGGPLPPSPLPEPRLPAAAPTISQVLPEAQWPFYRMEIAGSGFQSGARVTLGGVDASIVIKVA